MVTPFTHRRLHAVLAVLVGFCLLLPRLSADDDRLEFFRKSVEPLLKAKCLSCHSHATRTMEGGLTLDSSTGWKTGGDRGEAVVPGKPVESLLMKAVEYDDDDLQMPPDEKLEDSQITILRRWIEDGAVDPRTTKQPKAIDGNWWSLKVLKSTRPPTDGHPIDAFLGSKLQEKALQVTSPANRVTLIRRLYFTLLGYQPTPEEVRDFCRDNDSLAWEKLIDKLLSSPQYGERWARHWLDTVHFADSHGCEHDVKRPNAWRFRDYVINRLNEDVAWDRFIREQLAPDVFYPDEPQFMPGLGFIASGPLELSRAGTAPIAFDYLDRDDMVTQTMAAFASTTANCARCHTHKFDPITQEDYYALQAVFAGIGKGDIHFDSNPETHERRNELQILLAAVRSRDPETLLSPRYASEVDGWVSRQITEPVKWTLVRPSVFLSTGGAELTLLKDGSILASGVLPDQEVYTLSAELDLERLTAVRVEAIRDDRLPMKGPGRAGNGNFHLSEVELRWFPDNAERSVKLEQVHASADFDQDGWDAKQAIDGNLQTGWAIYPRINQSHQIVFELKPPFVAAGKGKLVVMLKQQHPPKHLIGRVRLSVTGVEPDHARIQSSSVVEALQKRRKLWTKSEKVAVAAAALAVFAKKQLAMLPPKDTVYGVSSSWSHAKKLPSPQAPKVVHLLRRGAFDQPVKEIGPGALSILKHLPSRFSSSTSQDEAQRRAQLADWLAHPENPLVWRSIVNRVWHYHFGRGLSDTLNDFGRMGSAPTHPELLDWLAVWFRDEAKGSLKKLHRLILTSSAWRRSSRSQVNESDLNARDANNLYLWRMNRQRLDADSFRDSVLKISGRLDLGMGGPGIEQFTKTKGPQATPKLDYSAYDWDSLNTGRRSIYRVVWRGIPDPFMEILDFPDLGLLAPKRGFSVSSLQSLALLNNDFVLSASRWMTARLKTEHTEPAARISRAVELVWLRNMLPEEKKLFQEYVQKHGLEAFCRLLLNSNEFLFVD